MLVQTPRISTGQQSQPFTLPAPVGGLNGRDPAAGMPATDAYLMDNIFPGTARVYSRRGCAKHIPAPLGGPVQNLEVYAGASGDKMLAWAANKVFDVSTNVPAELKTGLTNSLAVTAMFSNAADNAQHLIAVNGANTPWRYDGAAITDLALTGITTPATLSYVFAFKERLYFAAENKLGFYYLPVGAIQGALSFFDLAQVSKLGGSLHAIASFSTGTQGESPQDYIVFITTKGECIVYQGIDPSNASDWSLVGRFFTAQPIGKKCAINYQGDLLVLTLDGVMPMSVIMRSGDSKSQGVAGGTSQALTAKLGKFLSAFTVNYNTPGWMGLQYTSDEDGWLLLNVPASSSTTGKYYHYVMNTKTNAWCRYTGWNGLSFVVYNRRLYFGNAAGYVMVADQNATDDGQAILVNCKQAYNNFEDGTGIGALNKHFQWAQIFFSCDARVPLSVTCNVNFKENTKPYPEVEAPPAGAIWDVAEWDESYWSQEEETLNQMATLNNYGFVAALWLRMTVIGARFQWFATQVVFEKARGLIL